MPSFERGSVEELRYFERHSHAPQVVYMASGYNWCRLCAKNVKPRGEKWVHSSVPYDSYRGRWG
jgi:hypothetical protein